MNGTSIEPARAGEAAAVRELRLSWGWPEARVPGVCVGCARTYSVGPPVGRLDLGVLRGRAMSTHEVPYVLGIDSALSKTGVAVIWRNEAGCHASTAVVASPTASQSLTDRHHRIIQIVQGVRAQSDGRAQLALIEAPALDADHGNAWDRAAVWWGIVSVLLDRHIPVAWVAPTTLKKWATGRGGSKQHPVEKADVVRAMHEMWPGLPCTSNEKRHHECESLALSQIAAQYLGWPVPVRRHHADSLAVIKWPELATAKVATR